MPSPTVKRILLGKKKVATAAPAFSYLGSFNNSSLGAGTTATMPFTMTNTAGLLVVYFALSSSKTITSVVYDPGGANVTLTKDAFNNGGHTQGVWSGVIPAASGSKNIVVTATASIQFQAAGAHAWLCTNLISSAAQSSASVSAPQSASISVTSGYFMFGGAFNTGAIAAVNWSSSTQVPSNTRTVASNFTYGADWTIASTNASFTATPKSGNGFDQSYATYH